MSRPLGRIVMGCQIRAARGLLDWSRAELARAAGLHLNAVGYWGQGPVVPTGRHEPCTCTPITGLGISTTHMISKTVVREHRG